MNAAPLHSVYNVLLRLQWRIVVLREEADTRRLADDGLLPCTVILGFGVGCRGGIPR